MTPLTAPTLPVVSPPPAEQAVAIRICWTARTSMNGHGMRRFILKVDQQSHQHAHVEAWVEFGNRESDRHCVFTKQLLAMESTSDELMRHMDVFDEHGLRVAAITLLVMGEHRNDRLLFAQSSLLAAAGFTGGTYDPPTLM